MLKHLRICNQNRVKFFCQNLFCNVIFRRSQTSCNQNNICFANKIPKICSYTFGIIRTYNAFVNIKTIVVEYFCHIGSVSIYDLTD